MQRVKSEELNADDEECPNDDKKEEKITSPIGAGLPLLQRLRLLKEKQVRFDAFVYFPFNFRFLLNRCPTLTCSPHPKVSNFFHFIISRSQFVLDWLFLHPLNCYPLSCSLYLSLSLCIIISSSSSSFRIMFLLLSFFHLNGFINKLKSLLKLAYRLTSQLELLR